MDFAFRLKSSPECPSPSALRLGAHRGAVVLAIARSTQAGLLGRLVGLFPDRLEFAPQRRDLGLDARCASAPVPAACGPLSRLSGDRRGPLAGLLGQAHRTGEDALRADVDVPQLDPAVGEQELADLVGVRHAARLQDVQAAVALAAQLDVAQQQPGVDERGDADVGLLQARAAAESGS